VSSGQFRVVAQARLTPYPKSIIKLLGTSPPIMAIPELERQTTDKKNIIKETWWLMYCSFPDLNWAKLQVYADGSAQTFDCDGVKHNFENEEEAGYFLAEDEYTELDKLDTEDEQEIGIPLSSIEIPQGDTEEDLAKSMYVRMPANST